MAGKEQAHCKRGHPLTPDNVVYVSGNGQRTCAACRRESVARWNAKAKAARVPKPPKTHCKWGHEFTPENTYTYPRGSRACRECLRRRKRECLGRMAPERRRARNTESARRWRSRHRDHVREYARRRRAEHGDKLRAYARAYYRRKKGANLDNDNREPPALGGR